MSISEERRALADRIEQRVAEARKKNGTQVAAVHYHAVNDESRMVIEALRDTAGAFEGAGREAAIAAIRAHAAFGSDAVPLPWNEYEREGDVCEWDAETVFGTFYGVQMLSFCFVPLHDSTPIVTEGCESPDEAKAICEADYTRRLLSGLAPLLNSGGGEPVVPRTADRQAVPDDGLGATQAIPGERGAQPRPSDDPIGWVTYHSSEDLGPADVGISVNLGGGQSLWAGEISRRLFDECSGKEHFDSDGGHFIVWFKPEPHLIAKCADPDEVRSHMIFLGFVASCLAKLSGAAALTDSYEQVSQEMQAARDAADAWPIVEALRADEGSMVAMICDNPDFNGQPNCAVECCGGWTGWDTQRFTGDTVLDALRAAYAKMTSCAAR